ncbi:tyrosine-protein phosphatase [Flagellimonas pacifica]|uniref:protein-tyrosine-phosphatase n=1 Tax=Flagellimonas pacifica TaxID=1247520 RepID=A0A285MR53_9FLAO|nr:CpsB/CapC family capsule biosynthesis tyrosine phosphatase [Allomuricauda parva]SNY99650.1 Tyrosine-protein phosphatase YwqE [Allomuricauda parva]
MFSFFQKKVFLADYLHGLVDMHNHILPGIDDGCKTVDDSVELLNFFLEFGISNFICTPHIMNHYHPNTPNTIKESYNSLKQELSALGLDKFNIDYAAEHMIDDGFETLLEENTIMPLKKHHLLIEMSYLQPSFNFDSAVEKIMQCNYFPILAHPERYIYYHKKYDEYKYYKSKGIQFQLNFLSLSGHYGTDIQKTAMKLLNDNMIDFCASDAHNLKHLQAIKEIKISTKTLSRILPVIENTIDNFY